MTFEVSTTVVTADPVDYFIRRVTTDKSVAFIVTAVGNNNSGRTICEYVISETSKTSISMFFCNRVTSGVEVAISSLLFDSNVVTDFALFVSMV